MSLAPGTRLGPYEVVFALGAGGMGEVYKAKDTRLDRTVAIKILPAELAADPERLRRSEQEARAVAALNHPNILALYDVGTYGRAPYLVTELLEGESLFDRLRGGSLAVSKAVEIGVQVAQGLAAAHEKGIVHRDLKPANVFVTKEGRVKILDFGLAKLTEREVVSGPDAETLAGAPSTMDGTVLGTLGYISPEQLRGEQADWRSDIFSFGCVLYEVLSGKAPFARPTQVETATAILHDDPPPLVGSGAPVTPALQEIVGRCLEKRAEERFSSAHDLALALRACVAGVDTPALPQVTAATVPFSPRRAVAAVVAGVVLLAAIAGLIVKFRPVGPTPGAAGLKKVAVLPFENLGRPEDAYFASGMAEEITSRLANVRGLGVISRTSVVEYNRKGKTVKQIGADLGVDYVLEGSVRWDHGQGQEGRVRITPQLIRVADDTHVWADRYDRVLADVFAIQSEVAESTVRAMGVALLPPEKTRLKEISTNDLEAYDLYLQGMELVNRGSNREFLDGALQKLQAAVDRDPRFAQALAMLASTHLSMYWLGYDHSQERLGKAKELAERAVELRPDLAETHGAFAQYYYHGLLDFPRALAELAIATTIQPNNSRVLLLTGLILGRQDHPVEAAEVLSKAVDLDPRNPSVLGYFGATGTQARRYAEADRALELAIALSPQWSFPRAYRAELQIKWHGDVDKAQALLDEASSVPGAREGHEDTWQWVALLRRDYAEVLRLLEAQEPQVRDDLEQHSALLLLRGQVQALTGQPDLARRSYEAARVELEQLVKGAPNDSRFHGLLGIAYAGLGRRAEAVREAKLGRDFMSAPAAAPLPPADLAVVYTMVGQPGEAIALLDEQLSRSGGFTTHMLRLDPTWDPLRSDPRFQALLKKYEMKP